METIQRALEALEQLASMPCPCHHLTGHDKPCDCTSCEGTGLRFYWLTEECPCFSKVFAIRCENCWKYGGHSSSCSHCQGRDRVPIPLEQLQTSDLDRVAEAPGFSLGISYPIPGLKWSGQVRLYRNLNGLLEDNGQHFPRREQDKEAIVLALARAMELLP